MENIDNFKTEHKDTIVAFHIGRGGRFNNGGWLSCIGEQRISEFINELFVRFENHDEVLSRFSNQQIRNAVIDAIGNNDFEALAAFGVMESDLGEVIYCDQAGNEVGLTVAEAETGIGTINIDHQYNTTYTTTIGELSDDELSAVQRTTGFIGLVLNDLRDMLNEQEAINDI